MSQHDDSHKHSVSTAQVRERQADKQYHRGVAKVGGVVQSPSEGKTNILNKTVFFPGLKKF